MHVEGQNDEMLDSLLGKVKILKDITVGIGDEVRASNMELGGMVRPPFLHIALSCHGRGEGQWGQQVPS